MRAPPEARPLIATSPDTTIMPPHDGEDMAPTKRNDESENRINDERLRPHVAGEYLKVLSDRGVRSRPLVDRVT